MDFLEYAEASAALLNADLSGVEGLAAYLDDREWLRSRATDRDCMLLRKFQRELRPVFEAGEADRVADVVSGLNALMAVEHLVLPAGVSPEVARLRPTGEWLIGLIPALALILMQVAAEEVAFRGYLLQQLRARFRSPLVWAVLPALVFGALHFDPAT